MVQDALAAMRFVPNHVPGASQREAELPELRAEDLRLAWRSLGRITGRVDVEDLLERSISENGFTDRVRFQRAAAGAAGGQATLTFPLETLNSGGAYLLREGTAPLAGNQKKEVPVVALDWLDLRRPVRLIKMDVEGAEPQVLRGAARLLKEDRPVILSELHPAQLERASGVTPAQFLAQIAAFGYRAHHLENGVMGAAIDSAPADTLVSAVFVPLA
jgi:FkbM family methyltransferase